MKKLAFLSCLVAMSLQADLDTNRVLFLLHRGELASAVELYQASTKEGDHNHETLEQICLLILEQGFRSDDPEIQLMTVFGAGVAANEKALYILEDAVKSRVPAIQLVALNTLIRAQHDGIEDSLRYALRSPLLILRLEALLHLAENKNPKTASYAESLMAIVNEELLPIFPEIFAVAGDGASTKMLKKMISHPQENVRVASILSLAKHQRDDFLPKIRILATHHSPKQLEACAYAFGLLKDQSSVPRLEQLADSTHENVRVAALLALYQLGKKESKSGIEKMAQQGDLFAIAALKNVTGCEDVLASLIGSPNPHVRVNATMLLLEKKDMRCLPGLSEIILRDSRDYAFAKTMSKGHSSMAWKVIPSAQQQAEENPALEEQSRTLKAAALIASLELDDKVFLQIADRLLSSRQNDLVPLLVPLLENHESPETIALLKKYQQKAGAPFIRQHCNLALYRLKQTGPYEELVKDWILSHMHEPLFHFKQQGNTNEREYTASFMLTPDETSKLLIDSVEALARAQNDLSIDILLEAIKQGHPKNKYVLAGLLMRVAQ